MARLGGAASGFLIYGSSHAQSSPPRPPSNLRLAGTTTRSILGQNDFTYRGYYVVWSPDPVPTSFAQGFTHRYVGGQVRFLWLAYAGPGIGHYLLECSLPSNYGGSVTTTNQWNDIWNGTYSSDAGKWIGLWWDEPAQRLWTTGSSA
jgi:hypothetical protein